uniref:EF-1-gamma C-terminal domain-containing protein n=1 Tax=Ditylenchus dipsaci TaxID=166011 RepID=A0A915DGP7_9BILA
MTAGEPTEKATELIIPSQGASAEQAAEKAGDKPAAVEPTDKKAEDKPAAAEPAIEKNVEDPAAAEPKSTDPFADFPKGTFDMDAFKRVYSNEDTEAMAIPHFWNNFDPEHYSIWHCEYKFPEELKLTFMSCNLISGMFQRLEPLKKNAFGSVILFGSDNNASISGVWVWRGPKLVFELSPDWQVDYESYEWKKLDPKDDSTRSLVNEYLLWEGDFDGKKVNQGKIFK